MSWVNTDRGVRIFESIVQSLNGIHNGLGLLVADQITPRDLFAAAALAGICASDYGQGPETSDEYVSDAYDYADAMMKQRSR